MLNKVKHYLGTCFAMKDLGEAAYILGIKIYRDRSKQLLGLSQSTYIDKMMTRFKMENSKKGGVPMTKGTVLNKSQSPSTDIEIKRMEGVPYASAIGSIMYAMLCTRPDVSHALSMTSRYQQAPGIAHWTAVKNILKYLRRTKDMFLVFGGVEEELTVRCYTDASFQTDRDDSRSQSGFVFTLNGGAVSWKSSKQSVVADSTTESEYIATSDAAKEAAWMKKFITDLDVVPSIKKPIEIFCDNTGAIAQAKEPRSHHRAKHILRKFHYIREIVERGDIVISKVDTD
ncbi:putative RNA-directed DNA polymerase [Helianthus annuus]|nr:putative RNA-directed DNA polymerase [Helianthus annuus]